MAAGGAQCGQGRGCVQTGPREPGGEETVGSQPGHRPLGILTLVDSQDLFLIGVTQFNSSAPVIHALCLGTVLGVGGEHDINPSWVPGRDEDLGARSERSKAGLGRVGGLPSQ